MFFSSLLPSPCNRSHKLLKFQLSHTIQITNFAYVAKDLLEWSYTEMTRTFKRQEVLKRLTIILDLGTSSPTAFIFTPVIKNLIWISSNTKFHVHKFISLFSFVALLAIAIALWFNSRLGKREKMSIRGWGSTIQSPLQFKSAADSGYCYGRVKVLQLFYRNTLFWKVCCGLQKMFICIFQVGSFFINWIIQRWRSWGCQRGIFTILIVEILSLFFRYKPHFRKGRQIFLQWINSSIKTKRMSFR